MNIVNILKKAAIITGSVFAISSASAALEVSGINVDESTKIGNTELKLNGAGIRYKGFFKVYVAAIYAGDKKTSTEEVLALPGPKRVVLTMLREVNADTMSQGLIDGINNNTSNDEKLKFFNQMLEIGKIFGSVRKLKEKDTITVDWNGHATLVQINNKPVNVDLPEQAFYNSILKIWLGERPADPTLKRALLGGKQ
ncbi:chalcone isomerase family protein [Parachitinimonas caeni]|uniref:Chalcone isomerase family protein n=1 Tax=Parachitinimonas caeni TaxID=3031301 RepID=A0ABT7DWR5_9NEIS|nr:chalcone isomerase family protein [Parachitinimonas caeni]MDK2123610.1 chalcone isomerase family protein [Parachitinimonas caeni]